jgi:uncharacterized membrane protein YphA (DoxX/SURF4 family)
LLLLLARVLFGWTFVMSGWGKLMNISGFVATMCRAAACQTSWDMLRPSSSSSAASW